MDGRSRVVDGEVRNSPGHGCAPRSEVALNGFYMAFDRQERWYAGRGDPPSNTSDAQSVAVHELGHATGFRGHYDDDVPKPGSTVSATGSVRVGE